MGAHWHLWGHLETHWHLWGPLGAYGHLWRPMGTYWPLWGPMGAYGELWAPIGPYGDLWGPIGAYGVGGINFLHTHLDTNPPPLPPSIRSISDISDILLYTLQNQHATSDIRLYTQTCHGPIRTLFLGLISCLVRMTPCETMLHWPSPN